MASTTTSTKAKKKPKKTSISTAPTTPEDYEFGPTTTYTAGATTDDEPPRWFQIFIQAQDVMLKQLKKQITELVLQNTEVIRISNDTRRDLIQSQQRVDELEKTQQEWQEKDKLRETIIERQQNSIDKLTAQIMSFQSSIDTITTTPPPANSSTSYAAAAAAPSFPPSPPPTRSPTPRNDFACTIDLRQMDEAEKTSIKIRKGIESEVQKELGTAWKCTAVLRDSVRLDRLKIVCNTKEELAKVKRATTTIPRAKLAGDPLYPIKIDNVRTSSVLHPDGTLKEIKEILSEENDTEIARLGWFSAKQIGKAFGSMVVYLTKNSEAQRILEKGYFDVSGESAYARHFKRHPPKCFNCQKEGHIARNCTERTTKSGEMDITN